MALVNVGFEYAKAWIEGTITERNDAEALNNLFVQTYGEGVATIENYTNAEGTTFDQLLHRDAHSRGLQRLPRRGRRGLKNIPG